LSGRAEKLAIDCGENATNSAQPPKKAAVEIATVPGPKENAPSFPVSGSGSEQ
jgi:hypothetical protein